jgi:hypothetical protein
MAPLLAPVAWRLPPTKKKMNRRLRVKSLEIYELGDSGFCQVIVHFEDTPLVLIVDVGEGEHTVESVAGEVCHQVESKVCKVSATRIEKMVKRKL